MKRSRLRLACFIAIIIAVLYAPCPARQPVAGVSDVWTGLYLGPVKLGYSHSVVSRARCRGTNGYRIDINVCIVANTKSAKLNNTSTSKTYIDAAYAPAYQIERRVSSGHARTVEISYGKKTIKCKITFRGKSTVKSIPIPPDADLAAEHKYSLGVKKFFLGDRISLATFNVDRLRIERSTAVVLRREKITLKGKTYNALVVVHHYSVGDSTEWITQDGETIKEEIANGVSEVRETREEAMSGIGAGGTDISSIAVDKPLPNPRRLTELTLKLNGITGRDAIFSDARQTATYSADKHSAEYRIVARLFDSAKSARLPINAKQFAQYLGDTQKIQPSDKAMHSQAHEIVGDEKNAYSAARAIRDWVRAHVSPREGTDTQESAVDVLQTRKGVCRHSALLYTALARAAGIPSRVVSGFEYAEGAFYMHMWAESYVGEWVPMDPTLPDVFVDATHLKISEGDGDKSLVPFLQVLGRAKTEIIDYKQE